MYSYLYAYVFIYFCIPTYPPFASQLESANLQLEQTNEELKSKAEPSSPPQHWASSAGGKSTANWNTEGGLKSTDEPSSPPQHWESSVEEKSTVEPSLPHGADPNWNTEGGLKSTVEPSFPPAPFLITPSLGLGVDRLEDSS